MTSEYTRPRWFDAAVTLISKCFYEARTYRHHDPKTLRYTGEVTYPDMGEIRQEVTDWLEKEKFTHFEFGMESTGSCDTCWDEYPALQFWGKNKRHSFFDIAVDQLGGMTAVYEAMAESDKEVTNDE